MKNLNFVSSAGPATTSLLEFASLGSYVGFGVTVWYTRRSSEMSVSLTGLAWTLDQNGVLSLGAPQSQLIKSDDFTSGFQNTCSSLISDLQSAYLQLGDLEDPHIVGDGSHDDSHLVVTSRFLHVTYQTGNGQWWAVVFAHKQPLQDDLVELGIGPSGQEAVKLHQEPQINIITPGFFPHHLPITLVFDINTHLARWQQKRKLQGIVGPTSITWRSTCPLQFHHKAHMTFELVAA